MKSPQRKTQAKRKFLQASGILKRKLEASYQTSLRDDQEEQEPSSKKKKDDELAMYHTLMESLKVKFTASQSHHEKLQILTLSPFTSEETQRFFNTTNYMVKKSRKLKQMKGIMSIPDKMSKGRKLSDALKSEVAAFYESDDVSRLCPGRKDSVSVRGHNGEKERKQKRLVLANLKEVYSAFKVSHPGANIGFSTFASLRPPWCILAGSPGTHSVCVCVHHQNPKLMLQTLTKELDLTDCMKASVCDLASEKCMMNQCELCPGKEGVVELLGGLEELDFSDEITYQQWVTTDRCTLLTVIESVEDFIHSLSQKVVHLTRHHYVAQKQALYLNHLKESITPSECIIVGDFSENFSFIVQDAAQGYHWDTTQATLHPFVVYFRDENATLNVESHCMVSDTRQHTTATVYAFQKKLLDNIKVNHPSLAKVHYFSDGCAGQYKNRFNFINLCHHNEDFGLFAEWHFFATSHGKSACDGIGGTAKRLTLKASLQRPVSNQILTPQDMFAFCRDNIHGVHFYFVSAESIQEVDAALQERFSESHTLKGTQRYHRYVPLSTTTLAVHEVSSGPRARVVSIVEALQIDISDVVKGNYVACMYDKKVWYGIVNDISEEFGDFLIKFMHPSGGMNKFVFPESDDICWIEESDILCTIDPPSLTSSRGGYTISHGSLKKAQTARTFWDKIFM